MGHVKLPNQSFHFDNEKMLDMIHYKKCPFTGFKEITMFREAFQEFLS
jgi:hypothetical protein